MDSILRDEFSVQKLPEQYNTGQRQPNFSFYSVIFFPFLNMEIWWNKNSKAVEYRKSIEGKVDTMAKDRKVTIFYSYIMFL